MLVIISDPHLTDDSSGETTHEGAFRIFRERVRDLIYDASKRSDDRYVPVKEVHDPRVAGRVAERHLRG